MLCEKQHSVDGRNTEARGERWNKLRVDWT